MDKVKAVVLGAVLILGLATGCVFAADIEADSKITQVTIYPDSVVLVRSANLKLDSGEQKIIFSDIIPDIDENSLRAWAEGSAEVKLFGAQLKKEFLEDVPSERIRQLTNEIKALEDEKKKISEDAVILAEGKEFLNSVKLYANAQIPKDLVTKMPTVADLDGLLKFQDAKLKENFAARREGELKIREINEKINVLRNQLAEISGPSRKLKRSIVVDLSVVKPGTLTLDVSYLAGGVSWQPIYEARANFEKSEVELVLSGVVRQTSGEDWQEVEASLSTARPVVGGNMPYVSPWILRPYQQQRKFEQKYDALKSAPMSQSVAFEAVGGLMKEKEDISQKRIADVQYAQAEEKGIAVVYKLPKKVSIKSDGSEHKLPISSLNLSSKFEYSTYPRAALSAYLGSRVTCAPGLQLPAGRVNIFLSGDFVGASNIKSIGPGEEFDLYLGADENVKVKREEIEKKVDETLIGNIASSARRTIFKYKLTVENYKAKKISVKLFEAMPVSEDDRIKVKINSVSPEPKEKDWKDRLGVWLWELELEPGQKREIIYSYTIEHPREMMVENL